MTGERVTSSVASGIVPEASAARTFSSRALAVAALARAFSSTEGDFGSRLGRLVPVAPEQGAQACDEAAGGPRAVEFRIVLQALAFHHPAQHGFGNDDPRLAFDHHEFGGQPRRDQAAADERLLPRRDEHFRGRRVERRLRPRPGAGGCEKRDDRHGDDGPLPPQRAEELEQVHALRFCGAALPGGASIRQHDGPDRAGILSLESRFWNLI